MKRQWRIGRIVIAAMLVGFAGLVWFAWPQSPQWKIPAQDILGFDEHSRLLYTIAPRITNDYELNAINLNTGQCSLLVSLEIPVVSQAQDQHHIAWTFALSPNRSYLLASDESNRNVYVLALSSGQKVLELCQGSDYQGWLQTIAFSDNSSLLTLHDGHVVQVWDIKSKTRQHVLELPSKADGKFHAPRPECDTDHVQISPDCRWLAINASFHESYVFDLNTDQLLGSSEAGGIPRFLNHSGIVLFVHANGFHDETDFEWYDCNQHFQRLDSTVNTLRCDERFLGYGKDALISCEITRSYYDSANWLPEKWQEPVCKWLSSQRYLWWFQHCIRCRNPRTTEMERLILFTTQYPFWAYPGFKISTDTKFLALNDGVWLSLCKLDAGRPLISWLLIVGLALMATVLAWPRRIK